MCIGRLLASIFLYNPDHSGSAFLGLSPLRLALVTSITLAIVFLTILATSEWLAKANQGIRIDRLLAHRFMILLTFFLFLASLVWIYLLVFSPLRIERLYGYYQRWGPVFGWGILILVQFFCMALFLKTPAYWAEAWRDFLKDERTRKFRSALNSPAAGFVLLAISFLIALTKVYYGRFVDEGDNLSVGWLLSQGSILYRDVFSHHFPLPYYWVAGIVRIFGNSFAAVRISVMLLQIGLFAAAMVITRFYLVIGLTSLAWNLINQFQRGQEVLYVTFESIMMVVVFTLILSMLMKKSMVKNYTLLLVGLLLAFCILTDPLMAYPALVAFAALFLSGIGQDASRRLWGGFGRILTAGIFLYIFSAALLVRANAGLYTTGFMLVSLFAGMFLLVELRRPKLLSKDVSDQGRAASFARNIAPAAWFGLILVVGGMQFFTAFRGGYFLLDHWDTLMNNRHVTMYEKLGGEIHALTCNQKDVQILYYPNNPIVYFVTEIPPASKYSFIYPWVAEIGQQELIDELKHNPAALILINTSRKEGTPQGVTTYLAETIRFLNQDYVYLGANKWMSPQLASLCSVTPGQDSPIQVDENDQ
jgi:hypothetical protein